MSDGKKDRVTGISKSRSIEEIAEFWDSHSLSEHWDETREASFDVRAIRRRRITVDPDVYSQIENLAHLRGVSAETLINLWLAESLKKGWGNAQQGVREGRG